jgi:O-acetylhomoserine/O-acetylserine sulfhydrylase-like pyridoxal-dependent enzyme
VLIVAVSYDSQSLNQRIHALESAGHVVVPASSLESGLNALATDYYRLLIIGATVPFHDRERLAVISKRLRPEANIISVEWADSPTLELADRAIVASNEEELMAAVKGLE